MRHMGVALVAVGTLLWTSTARAMEDDSPSVYVERGEASWYGDEFNGRPTARGEPFDQDALTAAHPDLPLGAEVEVTNLANGRSVEVEINDRGPFIKNRVIDLSKGAAEKLDMVEDGTAPVRIEANQEELDKVKATDGQPARQAAAEKPAE